MKNSLADLNNVLFEQLDFLTDRTEENEEKAKEFLDKELKRSKQICEVATKIIDIAAIQVQAIKVFDEAGIDTKKDKIPELLTDKRTYNG